MKVRVRTIGAGIALVLVATIGAAAVAGHRPVSASASAAAPAVGTVTTPATTRHVAIKVSGMYCESCETTVRSMLTRTAGVRAAQVDVGKGLATVDYDPTMTSPANLAGVINRLGYSATVPADDQGAPAASNRESNGRR